MKTYIECDRSEPEVRFEKYRHTCIRCRGRKHPPMDKRKNSNNRLKVTYGITLDEYDKLFDAQRGLCAICGQPETHTSRYGGVFRLAVDHNHTTGNIRGLLCSTCNRAVGLLKDNTAVLLKAVAYLQKDMGI
jgi:hypothetical protein